MTVKELIEKLKLLDPNYIVKSSSDYYGVESGYVKDVLVHNKDSDNDQDNTVDILFD